MWPPYVIRQAIYIVILWFLLLSVFLPRLFSAGLKCAVCGSLKIQHAKKSPKSRHLGTIPSLGHPRKFQRVSRLQRYCTAFQFWASAKLCSVEQRAPPIFGRAAITLGIGPHSSSFFYLFPCLISAVADWMSTILPHMV